MRSKALSTANAGMTRLRRKGNASSATLYDCLNAYITIAGSIKPRPGTIIDINLPAGTKGLVAHKGIMRVFSHAPVTISDERYDCIVLRHPTNSNTPLRAIHFAKPFMGFLYVVAAFEDGSQWHYWTEELDPWEADTVYFAGQRVFPSIPNGYAYKATRLGSPAPMWASGVERNIGDVIEPTINNGYEYVCVSVSGSNPASGSVEPNWPNEEGATITEESFDAGGEAPPPTPGDDGDGSGDIDDRYNNPYWDFNFNSGLISS